MPHKFNHKKYVDMIFVYAYCNGSSTQVVDEYWRLLPTRRIPNKKVFEKVFRSTADTETFRRAMIVSGRISGFNAKIQKAMW